MDHGWVLDEWVNMASRSGQKSVTNNNMYTLCLTAGTCWWLRWVIFPISGVTTNRLPAANYNVYT